MKFAYISVALLVSGCATSTITGVKDPSFTSHHFGKIAVFALGMDLDAANAVESLTCNKLTPTPCATGKSVLPPTRARSTDEIRSVLDEQKINVALIVKLVSDDSESQTAFLASSQTMSSGGGAIWANMLSYSGSSVTTTAVTPIRTSSRYAKGELVLYDISSGRVAWYGQIKVRGSGPASSDDAFIKSATSAIAKEIKATAFFE